MLLVSSLSYCGYVELKPSSASVGSPFHIPGFTLPVPSGRGEYFGLECGSTGMKWSLVTTDSAEGF